jgi:hypothetical protein
MWIDNDNDMPADAIGFLIELTPQGRAERMTLRVRPGRTNQSQHARLYGWLGSTNNVSAHARGVARVIKLNAAGDRAMVEKLDGTDLADALETLGYPGLT